MYLPEGNAFPYLQASKVPTYLDIVDNSLPVKIIYLENLMLETMNSAMKMAA